MNKYQEALNKLKMPSSVDMNEDEAIDLLQELVDIYPEYLELKAKATPMKLDRDRGFPECSCGIGFHGKVENEVSDGLTINYCFNCGQSLDWSEDE